ncbi:M2 family metallopeptidase [Pseudoalteromonas sp. Hal099]
MATSRDYNELLDLWQGWRQISKPMRPLYEQQVTLTNEGAKELTVMLISAQCGE